VEALKPQIKSMTRVGFPAILGIQNSVRFVKALEDRLGCRIFEIPGLPPSVPGIRLHQILLNAIQENGGQVFQGLEAINYQQSVDGSRIEAVFTEAAARSVRHTAGNYILATGGILGGGIGTDHLGLVYDPVFDLPIKAPLMMAEWFKRDFLNPEGHPIFGAGIHTDDGFKTVYDNLFVIGAALEGDFVRERSLEGVALVSGFQVGEALV
jgi:glycerol-3-phosphate dehydrogenase subunit B